MCLSVSTLGEDHLEQPFLRSPDRRYLFWPFGGAVYDLETLRPLTEAQTIPESERSLFDFDINRPALTIVNDGRLVTFSAPPGGGNWTRSDDERASPRFGILGMNPGDPPLVAFASVGQRQYLAAQRDGVLARLDTVSGREVWRLATVGGEIADVQLNFERSHVLLMGKTAWRVFRLADGFAQSGLLAPPATVAVPPMPQTPEAPSAPAAAARAASTCGLADALGTDGSVLARCGRRTFAWKPRVFTGDLEPKLTHSACAADSNAAALDAIRRCYVAARSARHSVQGHRCGRGHVHGTITT